MSPFACLPSADTRRADVSYKRKYVHEVLATKKVWLGELATKKVWLGELTSRHDHSC